MQLGYKTVLLICIGVSVVTSEAISFLPAFTEHKPQVAWDSLSWFHVHQVLLMDFNSSLSPPWSSLVRVGHCGTYEGGLGAYVVLDMFAVSQNICKMIFSDTSWSLRLLWRRYRQVGQVGLQWRDLDWESSHFPIWKEVKRRGLDVWSSGTRRGILWGATGGGVCLWWHWVHHMHHPVLTDLL